ncbi:MAG TPA: ABC transporter permease [Gaiellaceae bacterium]|jgi:ABC-type transport system involved in multi-copper enzyme maturation permease subunit|nr:ABC transporter permease [Gaiellaceae bacterium]
MSGVAVVIAYALRESVRRRVFLVVLVLTAAFVALYWLGAEKAFDAVEETRPPPAAVLAGIDTRTLTGATLFGLSMFGTLFLGAVLAAFLTLGAVRGDAERGLLQPLVVRPIGRGALLAGRFLAAAAVCALYVLAVFGANLWITWSAGGWRPDRIAEPALQLAAAVAVIAAVSLLGSVFLTSTANGIAVFMVFGAGLVAGLLGQIGEVLESETLLRVADVSAWVLPFEALYQDGLNAITADTTGFTEFALQLGPFGGAQAAGPLLWPWTAAYLLLVGGTALAAFARKDL